MKKSSIFLKKPIDKEKRPCYNEYKFKVIEQNRCNGRKDEVIMNVTMKAMLEKLVEDFNNYSELVALNYAQKKEGKCDEGTLQWNRGNMNRIEEYMKGLADVMGVKLEYEYGVHSFGFDDWKRNLKKYKEAAEQHGLTVDKDAKYGWTVTTLNDEAKAFVSSFQDKKFELHRKSFPKIPGAAKTKQSTRKYVCPMCGTIIRATKEVHVVCGDCEVEFEEES